MTAITNLLNQLKALLLQIISCIFVEITINELKKNMCKYFNFLWAAAFFIWQINLTAQTANNQVGIGFSSRNQKSIHNTMERLIDKASKELKSPLDSITYIINESYTGFYTKKSRHLPKRVTFTNGRQTIVYGHRGLSGAVLYWVCGKWVIADS